jgi:hypothetical protein
MVVTWATAVLALVVGALLPSLHPIFAASPSTHLADALLFSIGLMAVHKVESYLTGEFDQCPVYLGLSDAPWVRGIRQAAFLVFCSVFLALAILIALAMRGPPWPLLVMAVWCSQGLHEIHHTAKSLARRRYYPGTASALVFVAYIDVVFFPAYLAQLSLGAPEVVRVGFYAAQPILLLAFFLEDRAWLVKMRRAL